MAPGRDASTGFYAQILCGVLRQTTRHARPLGGASTSFLSRQTLMATERVIHLADVLADPAQSLPYGALKPSRLDRAVIALTSRLPANRLGLRLAILLRRLVTMRLAAGALDVGRWGLNLRLHPLDNGCEKGLLFTPQMFEPEERAELAAEIARAGPNSPFVFIDIGANVGLFSLFVAAQAGGRARILAFEPEPGTFARLAFNVAANPALPIKPLNLALADEPGEVAIELDRRDRGGTRAHKLAAGDTGADLVRVPCRPLAAVLREEGIGRIDALKIDVEGMEDVVLMPFLRDAPPSLWPRLILIEDAHELWSADLFAELAARGYTVSSRSKLNVMLRGSAQPASGTGPATERPSVVTAQR